MKCLFMVSRLIVLATFIYFFIFVVHLLTDCDLYSGAIYSPKNTIWRHKLLLINSPVVRAKFSLVVMSVSFVAGRWTQTSRRGQFISGAEVSGRC